MGDLMMWMLPKDQEGPIGGTRQEALLHPGFWLWTKTCTMPGPQPWPQPEGWLRRT